MEVITVEIHWNGLLLLLKAIGIMVGFSAVAMVIGVPIVSLWDWYDRHHTPGEIGKDADWELNLLFGFALGCMIFGLILFVLFVPLE
jgi:hypothetical protein